MGRWRRRKSPTRWSRCVVAVGYGEGDKLVLGLELKNGAIYRHSNRRSLLANRLNCSESDWVGDVYHKALNFQKRELVMSRSFYAGLVVFCLSICPLSIGCGGRSEEVVEQTESEADMAAQDAAYEKEMEESGTGSGTDE